VPTRDWKLAIDFGTSFTSAAAWSASRVDPIEIGGERRIPSVVYVGDDGALLVGRAADNMAAARPERALREPKRLLGEPTPVVLGGQPIPVVDIVAAILGHVYRAAVEAQGTPPTGTVLTHPATWRSTRVQALRSAAEMAEIENVQTLPEPIGAALGYAAVGHDVDRGAYVAVYDLGGGTFDTAVLRRDADGDSFVLHGRPGGDGRVGGDFMDELLMGHVSESLDPAVWQQLLSSTEGAWRQASAALRAEVRKAKEALSLQQSATLLVALPTGMQEITVTRDSYERLIAPYVDETVALLKSTIDEAGVREGEVKAVYLVGGASRTPLVEQSVEAAFPDAAVRKLGDPKLVVASGAALLAARDDAVVAAASSGVPATQMTGDGQASGPFPDTAHDPGPPTPVTEDRTRRDRRRVAVAGIAAVALVAAIGATVLALTREDQTGRAPTAVVTPTPTADDSSPSADPADSPSSSASASASPSASARQTPRATRSPSPGSTDGGGGSGVGGGPISATPPPVVVTPRPATPRPATPRPATPAPTPAPVAAAMIAPPPGSTLAGSSATFSWTARPNVRYYSVWIGSNPPPNPNDAFAHSDVAAASGMPPSQTAVTFNGLPTDGRTLYVRLFTKINPDSGPLLWRDYVYTAASS
jgi:actin-like ATPase involved in cell morphogenesis